MLCTLLAASPPEVLRDLKSTLHFNLVFLYFLEGEFYSRDYLSLDVENKTIMPSKLEIRRFISKHFVG